MPELQFGPQSPSISNLNEPQFEEPAKADESARRRIRPGTKATDMAKGPPLIPLSQLDSPFQLQEHLKALFAHLTHGQSLTHSVPITKDTALSIARPPQINESEYVDKNLWLYELCRFLTMKANYVSCALMADRPPCSALTCPEMRASEWQYLCAVHEPPKSCCAIDYVNHTLDWAANVLTSSKHFPSRIQLGGETGNVFQSMRQLTNIFRRVYRIFAHAWFQHREVFWHIESTYGIYILFKTVCDEYQLIPEDNYTIPPEAEGPREEAETPINTNPNDSNIPGGMSILRKDNNQTQNQNGIDNTPPSDENTTVTTGATTRRHKHTPSTGSHVTTIAEGVEEDDTDPSTDSGTSPLSSTSSSSSPPKLSSDRAHPSQLGRLDIASTVPFYDPSQPGAEDPTPTAAQASTPDPLAAAGASQSPRPQQPTSSSPTRNKSSSPSKSRSPSKVDVRASPPKSVAMPPRRNSGFESEVRSPGGGSIRTGGPDLLNAILAHESDEEEEGDEGVKKSEGTVEGKEDESIEEVSREKSGEDEGGKQAAGVVGGDEKEDGEGEGEGDDLETMEKIELPDRTKVNEVDDRAEVEGDVAGEQTKESESQSKPAEATA